MATRYKARDARLSIDTGGGTYKECAGLQDVSLSISPTLIAASGLVGATSKQYASGAGLTNYSVSAAGVVKDGLAWRYMQTQHTTKNHITARLTFGNSDTFTGSWSITELSRTGEHVGAETFTFTLRSVGAITKA